MTQRARGALAWGVLAWLVLLLAGQVAASAPALAHAELIDSTPANGERLREPPAEVALSFTEGVGPVEGGFELLDGTGEVVPTAEPSTEGSVVRWPMPADLPDGAYTVNWRVISSDTHPIAGAFSFGVGVQAAVLDAPPETGAAPWPVTAARAAGYVGFAIIAGGVVFALVCWPAGRDHLPLRKLLRAGLGIAVLATVLGLLVQGPYVAGVSARRLLDPSLVVETAGTPYGAWMMLRLGIYLVLWVVMSLTPSLGSPLRRGTAVAGVLAAAVTFPGTGHAAASGQLVDRVVDSVHVLAAGIWVGGLLTIVVVASTREGRPPLDAFVRFSRVALVLMLVIVTSGTVNAVLRLSSFDDLLGTTYGRLLTVKLALVLVALLAALGSRSMLHSGQSPWSPVRFEAVTAGVVIGLTSVLTLTSPPSSLPTAAQDSISTVVEMDLGDGRTARLHVDGPTSNGTDELHLELVDAEDRPLLVNKAALQATLPSRDLGPISVPLTEGSAGWVGEFRFPLPGTWKLTLTVEDKSLAGVVTTGELDIG